MFATPYAVRFADVDNAGIFYYPRFFHMFHVAFEQWWESGVKRPYHVVIGEDKVGFPAVHIESDFKKPITFGDPMEVRVGVTRIGNTSVDFLYQVAHRETGQVHAHARIVKAVVNMDTFTAMPPPEHIRAALESILVDGPVAG